MRKAIVYCHDTEAGLLEESTPGRGYTFTYDKQYMLDRTHDPVSLTMPFREEPYQSDYLFPVFTNMLPEGANRKIVCRSWRLDEKDFLQLALQKTDALSPAAFPQEDKASVFNILIFIMSL